MKTDPIELEVFGKIFGALAEQMGLTIVRTAHTTFVRETQDFGAALATRDGWFFAYPRTPIPGHERDPHGADAQRT